ncbi:hypothetical protein U0355_13105 [Salimicrobium sp. PL1-032A]|uniref:hypothetical protein n=1 Tax=Salimicrobium sp. PL1-032A TaxID=3095364 RepID=UPI003261087B
MQTRFKAYDAEEEGVYVGVCNHYFKVSDANEAYTKALNNEGNDDTIWIEIGKDGDKEPDAGITFGVKEAEQFALTLLNISHYVKR